MGRVTNVRAYMRNGRPVRAHTRGVPGRTSGAGVVALVAVIGAFLLWGSGTDRTTPTTGGAEPRNSAYSAASPWAPVTLPDESPRLARPSWAGSELQGYRAGSDDCGADARLWVVQPGTSGMYRLTSACFGDGWKAEIVRKCRSYSARFAQSGIPRSLALRPALPSGDKSPSRQKNEWGGRITKWKR